MANLTIGLAITVQANGLLLKTPEHGIAFSLLILAGWSNMVVAIISLAGGLFQCNESDGKTFLNFLDRRSRPLKVGEISVMSLAMSYLRPREWPASWVSELIKIASAAPRTVEEQWLQLDAGCLLSLVYMDHQCWSDARRVLEHVAPLSAPDNAPRRRAHAAVLRQRALLSAWIDHDPITARDLLRRATHSKTSFLRAAEAAIALRSNDLALSRDIALDGIKLFGFVKHCEGVRLLDRDLLIAVLSETERQRVSRRLDVAT